ncbi:hypothetical protein M8494_13435 [Serratia ureilytica]
MATAIPQKYEHLERWAFGDTEQQADEVVQLILTAPKRPPVPTSTAGSRRPAIGSWWWTARVSRSARSS